MNKNHFRMLNYLITEKSEWLSGNTLASMCKVTNRTIRNWVSEINKEHTDMILSSRLGYKFNRKVYSFNSYTIDDEILERRKTLFSYLLEYGALGINLFDLSEKFNVSESTILSDISLFKETIFKELDLMTADNKIYIKNTESDIRQYMLSLIYSKSNIYGYIINNLLDQINSYPIFKINQIIKSVLSHYADVDNKEYSFSSLTYDIAICIMRAQKQCYSNVPIIDSYVSPYVYRMAEEIIQTLKKECQIEIPIEERNYIAQQILPLITYTFPDQYKIRVRKTAEKLLKKLNFRTDNGIYQEELLDKLTHHIIQLIQRDKLNIFKRNGNAHDTKLNYPYSFDSAFQFAEYCEKSFKINIHDEEIAMIALIFRAFLSTYFSFESDFSTLLIVSNDFIDIRRRLEKNFQKALAPEVNIESISDNHSNINLNKYDVIVTTDKMFSEFNKNAIYIQPFLKQKDINRTQAKLNQSFNDNKRRTLHHRIDKYFLILEDITIEDASNKTYTQILEIINQFFIEEGLSEKNWVDEVLNREEKSTSAYQSGFAYPHLSTQSSKETKITAVVLDKPIIIGSQNVSLLLPYIVSKNEPDDFYKLLSNLNVILSKSPNINLLTNTKTTQEFIKVLKELAECDLYSL